MSAILGPPNFRRLLDSYAAVGRGAAPAPPTPDACAVPDADVMRVGNDAAMWVFTMLTSTYKDINQPIDSSLFDTYFRAIDVLVSHLSGADFTSRSGVFLTAAGALLVARKVTGAFCDSMVEVMVLDLRSVGVAASDQQVLAQESAILNRARFKVAAPTPYNIICALVSEAGAPRQAAGRAAIYALCATRDFALYAEHSSTRLAEAARAAAPREATADPVARRMRALCAALPADDAMLEALAAWGVIPPPMPAGAAPPPLARGCRREPAPAATAEPVLVRMRALGEGAFGKVTLCRAADGSLVALKESKEAADDGVVPDVLREVAFLWTVPAQANIVRCLDAFARADGTVAVVYECHGADLAKVIENGWSLAGRERRVSEGGFDTPVLDIMFQVARAMDHLHAYGVMHCDLKPANILISRGAVKVADLGNARAGLSGEQTDVYCTVSHAAPESLLSGEYKGSFPADAWSAGAVFLDLLTGQSGVFWAIGGAKIKDTRHRVWHNVTRMLGVPRETPGGPRLPAAWVAHASRPARQLGPSDSRVSAADLARTLDADLACVTMILRLLEFDPDRRATFEEILLDPAFDALRPASPPPSPASSSDSARAVRLAVRTANRERALKRTHSSA